MLCDGILILFYRHDNTGTGKSFRLLDICAQALISAAAAYHSRERELARR